MTVISVTGASGFVGRHVCSSFSSAGHAVLQIGREHLIGDVLSERLSGTEVLIHLAARAHVLYENSGDAEAQFSKVNVDLTRRIADAAMRARVKQFVFLSSAGVLGATSPNEGFGDDSPAQPHDAYTRSKLQAELWLKSALPDSMGLAIVRVPMVYGPGARGNFQRLLNMAMTGTSLPIGGLRAPRSMISVRNLVDLLHAIVNDRRPYRGSILAADQASISVSELYRELANCAGCNVWLPRLPRRLLEFALLMAGRRADIRRLTGAFLLRPTVARRIFDWVPPYALADELRWTVESEMGRREK